METRSVRVQGACRVSRAGCDEDGNAQPWAVSLTWWREGRRDGWMDGPILGATATPGCCCGVWSHSQELRSVLLLLHWEHKWLTCPCRGEHAEQITGKKSFKIHDLVLKSVSTGKCCLSTVAESYITLM